MTRSGSRGAVAVGAAPMPANAENHEAFLVPASLAGETTEATMRSRRVSGAGCSDALAKLAAARPVPIVLPCRRGNNAVLRSP